MICPNCGSSVPDGQTICSCGAVVYSSSSQNHDEDELREIRDEIRKENVELFVAKARRLAKRGQYLEAIEEYDNAIALNSSLITERIERADAYFNSGLYEDALDAYYDCYFISAVAYRIYKSIADTLFELGRYEEAIENYETAIEKTQDSPTFSVHVNSICQKDPECVKKRRKEAEEKKKKKEEFISRVFNRIGWVYNRMEEYEKAIKFYERAIEFDYEFFDNWNCKAIALENMGRFVEALKFYDIALEMGGDETVRQNREECLKRYGKANESGDYSESSEYLEEALSLKRNIRRVYNEDDNHGFAGYSIFDFDED